MSVQDVRWPSARVGHGNYGVDMHDLVVRGGADELTGALPGRLVRGPR